MEYRYMGKTGLQLSALSFGSWISFHKQIDLKTADELMGIAYDHGVNFFDNAEVYALGESELLMGKILKQKNWDRTSVVISSKAFFGWRGKENKPNQTGLSRKHLTEACHEALKRLQVDYLDLFYCHRPDKRTPMEEVVWTMHQLIQQGKILYWGTSEWSGVEIMEAHRVASQLGLIGPVVEQPQYNLFERNKMENEYLGIFNTVGMGTTIWSPLASGFLTGKYTNSIPEESRFGIAGLEWLKNQWMVDNKINKVKKLSALADELGIKLSNLAIAFCIRNPNVTSVILGATQKGQLIENLKSLDTVHLLNEEIIQRIEAIVETKPILPEY